MKSRIKKAHMEVAGIYARLSYAKRRQVGCTIVKDDVLFIGYNGTPEGWDNQCEDADGVTLPYVLHAEQNALDKMCRSNMSSVGASVFVTKGPCPQCALKLIGARVKEVFFVTYPRKDEGIHWLRKAGILCEQLTGD